MSPCSLSSIIYLLFTYTIVHTVAEMVAFRNEVDTTGVPLSELLFYMILIPNCSACHLM
jgi:hypothetical protein